MLRLALIPLVALPFLAQRIDARTARVAVLSDSTATVVTTWRASRADSVRLTYSTGVARTRPAARGVDTLLVPRTTAAQTVTVTLTPVRGTTAGQLRSASVTVAARPEAPPSIDSVRVDTAGAVAAAPVVTPPPVTGPVVVPSAFTPNLPSGLTLVGDADFETLTTPGLSVINWERNTVQSPTTHGVALMTVDGRSVVRAWFPEQHAGNGTGPLTITTSELNSRSLYVAVRLRYSPNYVFHTNGEKLVLPMAYQPGDNGALINIGPNGTLQAIVGTMGAMPAPLGETVTGPVVPRGQWFTFEYYTRYNSPGQSDGTQRVWVDGRLVLDRQALNLAAGANQVLFRLGRLDFTRGGGASSVLTPPGGQWVDVDRLAFYVGH